MGAGGRVLTRRFALVGLALLCAAGARAAPEPAPVEVAAGHDVEAWRDLHARRLGEDDAVPLLQDFLARYPASPLAEVAWARVRAAGRGAETLALHPHLLEWQPWWERSLATHHEALTRHTVAVAVAPLAPDGSRVGGRPSRWLAGISGGGGFDGQHPWAGVGFRIEVKVLGVVGRVGWADQGFALAGVRLGVPSTLPVGKGLRPLAAFGELSARTDGRITLSGGGRLVLTPRWWLEATAGASYRAHRFGPAIAIEAVMAL